MQNINIKSSDRPIRLVIMDEYFDQVLAEINNVISR